MTSPIHPQAQPIPLDLRLELPDPHIPWMIGDRVFAAMQQGGGALKYKKVEVLPTDKEWRFVWRYFHHDKPKRYGLSRIYCIHERHQTQSFELNLSAIERDAEKFKPTWGQEPRADQRRAVIQRWTQITQLFSPFNTVEADGRNRTWSQAKALPLWHGSTSQVCHSIAESGFIFFGKTSIGQTQAGDPKSTDEGYFGSGIYFTNSARYAADIYSRGHLLLAWVSMREPFPVVGDPSQQDMAVLKGKGAYKQYDTHYIPVTPIDADPYCAVYHPCQPGIPPTCDELVVFQRPQTLPRFWVELHVELPYQLTPTTVPSSVSQLIPHLMKLLQHPHIDQDLKLRKLLTTKLALLLPQDGDEDLADDDLALFSQLSQLIKAGQVDKTVRQALTSQPNLLSSPINASSLSAAGAAALVSPIAPSSAPSPAPKTPSVAISSSSKPAPLPGPALTTSVPSYAFGAAKWKEYFGDVGLEPPLPANIEAILNASCPYWPDKKVSETHMLVLIPEKVNGRPLTLNTLGELVKTPKKGNASKCGGYNPHIYGDTPAPVSHWILMTREVIPNTRRQLYTSQKAQLKPNYTVPKLLDATTAIFMQNVSGGKHGYGSDPWTYTCCEESGDCGQMVVGALVPGDGLSVDRSECDSGIIGVAGARKFV